MFQSLELHSSLPLPSSHAVILAVSQPSLSMPRGKANSLQICRQSRDRRWAGPNRNGADTAVPLNHQGSSNPRLQICESPANP